MSLYSLKSATLSILTLRWQPPVCRGADFQTAKIGCCAAMRHAVVMAEKYSQMPCIKPY
jgi:hypothetical protein